VDCAIQGNFRGRGTKSLKHVGEETPRNGIRPGKIRSGKDLKKGTPARRPLRAETAPLRLILEGGAHIRCRRRVTNASEFVDPRHQDTRREDLSRATVSKDTGARGDPSQSVSRALGSRAVHVSGVGVGRKGGARDLRTKHKLLENLRECIESGALATGKRRAGPYRNTCTRGRKVIGRGRIARGGRKIEGRELNGKRFGNGVRGQRNGGRRRIASRPTHGGKNIGQRRRGRGDAEACKGTGRKDGGQIGQQLAWVSRRKEKSQAEWTTCCTTLRGKRKRSVESQTSTMEQGIKQTGRDVKKIRPATECMGWKE